MPESSLNTDLERKMPDIPVSAPANEGGENPESNKQAGEAAH